MFHDQKGMLLETYMKTNRMFVIHAEHKNDKRVSEERCLKASESGKENDIELWHRRFGHLNSKSLQAL